MSGKIEQDYERFRKIVQGKVRENLQKHIIKGGMAGQRGKKKITIPLPYIDLPHFKYGDGKTGVGSGDGEEGDVLDVEHKGDGKGEAGNEEGEHRIEVEVDLDELVDLAFENLKLPRIEEKGKKNITEETYKYTGISTCGPESLRHNKRTFKQALKREISMGNYNPDNPIIIPVREDKRYRSRKRYEIPKANAVIIYMMDVSGSMGDKQKEIVRVESYFIDKWLRKNYDGIESRFITHDASAREVDRETFFTTRESGGTMISSAYKLCAKLIEAEYHPSQWNIYAFHFSDGDNWSKDDSMNCVEIMQKYLLPSVNMLGYGQVASPYGSGEFIKVLAHEIDNEKLILSEIEDENAILKSIREFFNPEK